LDQEHDYEALAGSTGRPGCFDSDPDTHAGSHPTIRVPGWKSWSDVSDSNGQVLDHTLPRRLVHDQATYERWQFCTGLLARYFGVGRDDMVVRTMAVTMFEMDIPTYPTGSDRGESTDQRPPTDG